jgi:hypothetical protein
MPEIYAGGCGRAIGSWLDFWEIAMNADAIVATGTDVRPIKL